MVASAPSSSSKRLVKEDVMAGELGCSTETLRNWRRKKILTRGVYHRKGTNWLRYNPDEVLEELREAGKR